MLEETPDDRDHADALGAPNHARPERTDSAHDEVDLHAIARGAVKGAHHVRIREPVQLRDDTRWVAGARMLRFSLDPLQDSWQQMMRRDKKRFRRTTRSVRRTGELV